MDFWLDALEVILFELAIYKVFLLILEVIVFGKVRVDGALAAPNAANLCTDLLAIIELIYGID